MSGNTYHYTHGGKCMIERAAVLKLIYGVIDKLNKQRKHESIIVKDPATALLGSAGSLDSLSFIHFVVAVEEAIEQEFQTSITLTEEHDLADEESPFRTIGSLADRVVLLLEEKLYA